MTDDAGKNTNILEDRFKTLHNRLKADGTYELLSRGVFLATNRYFHDNQGDIKPIEDNVEIIEGLINSIMDSIGLPEVTLRLPSTVESGTPNVQLIINEPKGGNATKHDYQQRQAFANIGKSAYYCGTRNARFIAKLNGEDVKPPNPYQSSCCYAVDLLHEFQTECINPVLDHETLANMQAHIWLDQDSLANYPIQITESLDSTCDQLFNPPSPGDD